MVVVCRLAPLGDPAVDGRAAPEDAPPGVPGAVDRAAAGAGRGGRNVSEVRDNELGHGSRAMWTPWPWLNGIPC